MRVYHFINERYGLDDLRKRRLKIATVEELNDPFELLGFASRNRPLRVLFERWKHSMAASVGVVCFSRDWSNPVQWSHYADRHRGLCLGFEVPDEQLVEVEYRPSRIEPDVGLLADGGPVAEQHLMRTLATKFSHWRYEGELRVFGSLEERDEKTSLYFVPFCDNLCLKEVIVGHSSTLSRDRLANVLRKASLGQVTLCKARLAFRSFRIVKQRNRNLW
jgi:hypothetical protein